MKKNHQKTISLNNVIYTINTQAKEEDKEYASKKGKITLPQNLSLKQYSKIITFYTKQASQTPVQELQYYDINFKLAKLYQCLGDQERASKEMQLSY